MPLDLDTVMGLEVDIRGTNAILRTVTPESIESYVTQHGFEHYEDLGEKGRFYHHPMEVEDGPFEVFLSLKPEFTDYALRVKEVLQTMEQFLKHSDEYEARTQLQILSALLE